MDNENVNMAAAEDTAAQEEPPALVKKIGSMTYIARAFQHHQQGDFQR